MKLEELIKKWKFDYVNNRITDGNFPVIKRKHGEYKLFSFNKFISSELVIEEMAKEGYLPATLIELLEWTKWNNNDWVVALGSVAVVDGSCGVPHLDGSDSERGLYLDWWDGVWHSDYRFLAVRNLSFDTRNLDLTLGHSESLKCPHCGKDITVKLPKE